MDSGVVGVIDLSDNTVTKMETKHENVGNLAFLFMNDI
jgi:hypothetical protein